MKKIIAISLILAFSCAFLTACSCFSATQQPGNEAFSKENGLVDEMYGRFKVQKGGDNHEVVIKTNGVVEFVDGSDVMEFKYEVVSDTEIALYYDGEKVYTFKLDNDLLYRYEMGTTDVYVYKK